MVKRPKYVTVRATDRHGKEFEMSGSDLLARAFCHELEHLDGKLFIDSAEYMLEEDDE
jgi:peptide deformylase